LTNVLAPPTLESSRTTYFDSLTGIQKVNRATPRGS